MVKTRIAEIFNESSRIKQAFLKENLDLMEQVARALARVLAHGKKILLFGNGGSAADAQHIAAEFVNRYMLDRPPLPALALTTDSSIITAISNDFGYEEIFEKQLKALGNEGDAAVGISTSGKSVNVVRGIAAARENRLLTVGIGGPQDSPMKQHCDYYLSVQGPTPRVQEVHQLICHTLVEIIDQLLFGSGSDAASFVKRS
ncbi:MAG: D-sedoheptulose 7-phosphate isomerase [Desulfomonile tiedjei]|uniref:D-sedoheptulose 7-phosphate isomerase n=1 Tax=Desulfomonile tiedjei TaxID=2358 RepID=A0A9D6Z337_9BACT|nr:D-sedoheptulose 7-phosphate isomerase [Desulfomonile tiedjei]